MYDYPAMSQPSPPPSPHKHHQHPHRRSHSPIPHIATLLPHHHHSPYSPATRASDISRLLDPAYASSSSSASGSSSGASPPRAQTRAYVDHRGDLHDPDYRDFPVLRPTARAKHASARHRRASNGTARSRSTSRGADPYAAYRPGWERDWSTEHDEDDEDDEDAVARAEDDDVESPFVPRKHAHARRSLPAATYAYPTYVSPYSHFFGEAAPVASSPVGSLEEESPLSDESPFCDASEADAFVDEPRTRRSASFSKRFSRDVSAPRLPPSEEEPEFGEVDDDEPAHAPKEHSSYRAEDIDFTPSCTYSLRQQWTAILLRIRFGVFHAKRRFSRRRHST